MKTTAFWAGYYGFRLDASEAFIQGYLDEVQRLDQRGQGVACGRGWIPRSKKCSRDKASQTSDEAKAKTVERAKARGKLKGEVKSAKGQKARNIGYQELGERRGQMTLPLGVEANINIQSKSETKATREQKNRKKAPTEGKAKPKKERKPRTKKESNSGNTDWEHATQFDTQKEVSALTGMVLRYATGTGQGWLSPKEFESQFPLGTVASVYERGSPKSERTYAVVGYTRPTDTQIEALKSKAESNGLTWDDVKDSRLPVFREVPLGARSKELLDYQGKDRFGSSDLMPSDMYKEAMAHYNDLNFKLYPAKDNRPAPDMTPTNKRTEPLPEEEPWWAARERRRN